MPEQDNSTISDLPDLEDSSENMLVKYAMRRRGIQGPIFKQVAVANEKVCTTFFRNFIFFVTYLQIL